MSCNCSTWCFQTKEFPFDPIVLTVIQINVTAKTIAAPNVPCKDQSGSEKCNEQNAKQMELHAFAKNSKKQTFVMFDVDANDDCLFTHCIPMCERSTGSQRHHVSMMSSNSVRHMIGLNLPCMNVALGAV